MNNVYNYSEFLFKNIYILFINNSRNGNGNY